MSKALRLQQNKSTIFDKNTPSSPFMSGKQYSELGNFRELSVGAGSSIFKANSEGVFSGANRYDAAPFRLSYAGNLYATSGTIAGNFSVSGSITLGSSGYINRGKTSYADTTAGFWLDNRFHIGSSATKYFKYDGTDISMEGGTITGGTIQTGTTGYRTVLNSSNILFYNGSTQKGFMRPDSAASMVFGSADEIYFTNLSGTPNFKFSSAGHIFLEQADSRIEFESGLQLKDHTISGIPDLIVEGSVSADQLFAGNGDTDEYYVATSDGGSPDHKITVVKGIIV